MGQSSLDDETKVYISPLTLNTTQDHVREIFGHFGKVKTVEIFSNENEESKKYCVVDFENHDDAKNSISHMNQGEIDGLKVKVGFKNH